MSSFRIPLLGFSAYSGAGKTTLLTQLLPLLKSGGRSVGVVKHAHHYFDIDHPGKDSYELRMAGADQVVAASRKRIAWIREYADDRPEASLQEALQALQSAALDLVLVEGFKSESFPKIEVHRPALGKPLLYPGDDDIIAIATDGDIAMPQRPLQQLDLNRPEEIAAFILRLFP